MSEDTKRPQPNNDSPEDSFESENDEFQALIEKDKEKKREKASKKTVITFREYLQKVQENPSLAETAMARLWRILKEEGFEEIAPRERFAGVDKRSLAFSDELFGDGADYALYKLVEHVKGGANKASTARLIPVLIGPPATGKSTASTKLMKLLESYNEQPVYTIRGCELHEEPLHLLPRSLREAAIRTTEECEDYPACVEEGRHIHLGVKIEGDLCPKCRHMLLTEYKDDESGEIRWWDVEVEPFTFSIQGARGITSFEPSDEKGADITALSGRENVGVTAHPDKGYSDPDAYNFSGEIPKANRGIIEFREIFSNPPEILKVVFSLAQEKQLKIQGSSFPHLFVDVFPFGHTNLHVFNEFRNNPKYEGLHDRFKVIPFPYPLRVRDEVKIYRKLIERESDLVRLQKCHIAPGALELAALFAVMTRLKESKLNISPLVKAKILNGDVSFQELQDIDRRNIDIRQLREEGRESNDISEWEGMTGVSSRTILQALNDELVAQSSSDNGCLTPRRVIKALKGVFDERMGFSPEDVDRYRQMLTEEEDSVLAEYRERVVRTVQQAFLEGHRDLAKEQFDKYIKEIELARAQNRKFAHDPEAVFRDEEGELRVPDEEFMRSVEQYTPWASEEEATVARGEILELKSGREDFGYDNYAPLRRAVDKKLLADMQDMLTLVLSTDKPKGDSGKRRTGDLFEALEREGHCKKCAREAVENARDFLKR